MLKKSIFTILVGLLFSFSSYSQSYGSIEWDIVGIGYSFPFAEENNGGISLYTEPRYNINDNISVGLRGEIAFFGSDLNGDVFDIGTSASFALLGDYYFQNKENKRTFAGFGLGNFTGATVTSTIGGATTEQEGENSIGLIPRVGYEFKFVRLAAEYNLAFKETVPNYFTLKIGLNLGGRYKG